MGLCGNCNDEKDDLRIKVGDDVFSRWNKYFLIGDSFKVFDDVVNFGEKYVYIKI